MTTLETANNLIDLATLYYMQSLLARMYAQVEQTKGTLNPKIITVVNDNLYRLAAQYYGNADQWGIIATANSLYDPEIVGIKTIIIPDWDGLDRGGILDA